MNMPDMDGASTLKRIRLLPSRAAKVPVVAMTADSTEAHRENYLGAGMDGLLAKPLTPEGLLAILEQHLPLAGNNLSVRS
jgi:CheY-like chemotaxis protein